MKRMNTWLNAKSNSGTKSNREVDYLRKSVRHLDAHIIENQPPQQIYYFVFPLSPHISMDPLKKKKSRFAKWSDVV